MLVLLFLVALAPAWVAKPNILKYLLPLVPLAVKSARVALVAGTVVLPAVKAKEAGPLDKAWAAWLSSDTGLLSKYIEAAPLLRPKMGPSEIMSTQEIYWFLLITVRALATLCWVIERVLMSLTPSGGTIKTPGVPVAKIWLSSCTKLLPLAWLFTAIEIGCPATLSSPYNKGTGSPSIIKLVSPVYRYPSSSSASVAGSGASIPCIPCIPKFTPNAIVAFVAKVANAPSPSVHAPSGPIKVDR